MRIFTSKCREHAKIILPEYTSTRVMMMPLLLGDVNSIPPLLAHWRRALRDLFDMAGYTGQVGYITIDEKLVKAGTTHRRAGLHVDGVYGASEGSWGGGGGGSWGGVSPEPTPAGGAWGGGGGSWGGGSPAPSPGGSWGGGGGGSWGSSGLLTVASYVGCRAWNQFFQGKPGPEGECDHLRIQCRDDSEVIFQPNTVYWMDGMCVHESIPMVRDTLRQFVRLSLPSTAPWFEGYTENPLGVKPTGTILPRREFMNEPVPVGV